MGTPSDSTALVSALHEDIDRNHLLHSEIIATDLGQHVTILMPVAVTTTDHGQVNPGSPRLRATNGVVLAIGADDPTDNAAEDVTRASIGRQPPVLPADMNRAGGEAMPAEDAAAEEARTVDFGWGIIVGGAVS